MVSIPHEDLDRFIEAFFDGIKVNHEDKEVSLFLRDHDGMKWILMAEDVSDCMVFQMNILNIIDRITFWDDSSNEKYYIDQLFCLYCGYYIEEEEKVNKFPFIREYIKKIKCNEAFLIELEPVYGANVLVLAKRVRLWLMAVAQDNGAYK